MQYRLGSVCTAGILKLRVTGWDPDIGSTNQEKFALRVVVLWRLVVAELTELKRVKFTVNSGQVRCDNLNSLHRRRRSQN
ncbi:MAG: hypothetical protein DMG49_04815 [Acidobacteria bacterium]|nr:MAG: hypothetical protein DMG49_04815 [Acidobacteriota bacterium]